MKIPIFGERQNKKLLKQSIQVLSSIRNKSEILAICAQSTGYSWLGVNVATKSLFPECMYEIPQYYSNSVFSNRELVVLCHTISELDFKQVVFSGFAPFYEQICRLLEPGIRQKVIYHGFLAELSDNPIQQKTFQTIIELSRNKTIQSIGFVKKGLALSAAKKYGVASFEIILPNRNIKEQSLSISENEISIGCLVNTSFRKNIHAQVMAASMVTGAKIHVFHTTDLQYLDTGQIVYHNLMQHNEFVALLGKMTLNLHVTLSESWGQVLSESISQGVPCLSAYTSAFFDYDEELNQKLIVSGFDDSWHIYTKIVEVLKEREYLSKRCMEYATYLNTLAQERLDIFLHA